MVKQEIRFSLDIPRRQIGLRKTVTPRGTTTRWSASQCWAVCEPQNTRARDDVRARVGGDCSRDLVVTEVYPMFRAEANDLPRQIWI